MKKGHEYAEATHTRSGYAVKDVEWNKRVKIYLGMVKDPLLTTQMHPWVTCMWTKKGRCLNQNRPDCDLVLPSEKSKPSNPS